MDQLKKLFGSLTPRQWIYIAAAGLAVLGGIFYLLHWQREQDFVVLYSALSPEDASAVVQRLKETGVEYRVGADSASVKVHSAQVPDLRLQMAGAGIPKTGRIGFELFDRANLGLTEFAEQVNYHRALEGELERTVMNVAEVEQARLHITPAKDSVFLDQRRPAKASVLLKLRRGSALSPVNVKAITHLVASAVEGLGPENVSVLDIHGNLLARPQTAAGAMPEVLNESLLAYRRSIEKDLLAKVNQTLEPLLGSERFRAAVSVDCDLSDSEQSEESFDPNRSVMTTSQRSEDASVPVQPSGVPGAASNLPRPFPKSGPAGQGVTRRNESINYASSRLIKRVRTPQGNLRRISVSVLLDHMVRYEGAGPKAKRIVEPPPPERIKATKDLVAGVVGFQAERGDQVIVESLPFESTATPPAPPPTPEASKAAPANKPFDIWAVLKEAVEKKNMAVLGLFAAGPVLLLAGGALLLLRRRKKAMVTVAATPAVAAPARAPAEISAAAEEPEEDANDSEISSLEDKVERELAAHLAGKKREEDLLAKGILTELASNLKLPSAASKKSEVLGRQLSDAAKKHPDRMAQIVRTWMSDGDVERI